MPRTRKRTQSRSRPRCRWLRAAIAKRAPGPVVAWTGLPVGVMPRLKHVRLTKLHRHWKQMQTSTRGTLPTAASFSSRRSCVLLLHRGQRLQPDARQAFLSLRSSRSTASACLRPGTVRMLAGSAALPLPCSQQPAPLAKWYGVSFLAQLVAPHCSHSATQQYPKVPPATKLWPPTSPLSRAAPALSGACRKPRGYLQAYVRPRRICGWQARRQTQHVRHPGLRLPTPIRPSPLATEARQCQWQSLAPHLHAGPKSARSCAIRAQHANIAVLLQDFRTGLAALSSTERHRCTVQPCFRQQVETAAAAAQHPTMRTAKGLQEGVGQRHCSLCTPLPLLCAVLPQARDRANLAGGLLLLGFYLLRRHRCCRRPPALRRHWQLPATCKTFRWTPQPARVTHQPSVHVLLQSHGLQRRALLQHIEHRLQRNRLPGIGRLGQHQQQWHR